MSLTNDLISQFVRATADDREPAKESTVYGSTVEHDGRIWVKLDGSELLTPISTTTDAKPNERVTVMIKDHTAVVTGNLSSPSARTDDVKELGSKVTEFEIIIADKVSVKQLTAEVARIKALEADNVTVKGELEAAEAIITELQADNLEVKEKLTAHEADISYLETKKLDAEVADLEYAKVGDLEATDIEVNNLKGTHATFQEATAKKFEATDASIKKLDADKLDAESAKVTYANIDFSNIEEAAIRHIFGETGLIKDLTVGDQTLTGELVGVTISGDLIKANTLKADKLVVKGSDGLYYKLNIEAGAVESAEVSKEELQNGLHGTAIIAKTITAEKISVSDLVAFGATIGGYHITNTALYSGVKSSATNTTRGVYLGSDGQMAVGDSNNFLRYYKDANGNYILEVSADSIRFGAGKKTVDEAIDCISVGGRNLLKNSRHVTLMSNNSDLYPIESETLSDENHEFKRYYRTSVDLNPGTMSLYSAIKVSDITEHLTGKEITFSFLVRCSHETSITTMNALYADGASYAWSSEQVFHQIDSGWTRIYVTAIIDREYEQNDANLIQFNPLQVVIPAGEIENFYLDVCEWKIEKGNKATDWTPAPEDMASNSDMSEVRDEVESVDEKVGKAQSLIEQLSDSISMLVTDGNGTSLMTQTENGWTFSTAKIQEAADTTRENLDALLNELGSTNGVVDVLQASVDNLKTIGEYVKIGTYKGEPCIELGEGDSEFKLIITNTQMLFIESNNETAKLTNQSLVITKAVIDQELRQGGFVWQARTNGNLGLIWKGVTNNGSTFRNRMG